MGTSAPQRRLLFASRRFYSELAPAIPSAQRHVGTRGRPDGPTGLVPVPPVVNLVIGFVPALRGFKGTAWEREYGLGDCDWAYDDYTGMPRGENWPQPPVPSNT
jgi:hypothetical protein